LAKTFTQGEYWRKAKKGEASNWWALSALMTTTMRRDGRVIKKIKEENLPVKVIIGGAAVSQSYRRMT